MSYSSHCVGHYICPTLRLCEGYLPGLEWIPAKSHVSQDTLFSVERHGISSIVSHKELYSWPSFAIGEPIGHPTPPQRGGVANWLTHHLISVSGIRLGYPWARGVPDVILKEIREANFLTFKRGV